MWVPVAVWQFANCYTLVTYLLSFLKTLAGQMRVTSERNDLLSSSGVMDVEAYGSRFRISHFPTVCWSLAVSEERPEGEISTGPLEEMCAHVTAVKIITHCYIAADCCSSLDAVLKLIAWNKLHRLINFDTFKETNTKGKSAKNCHLSAYRISDSPNQGGN